MRSIHPRRPDPRYPPEHQARHHILVFRKKDNALQGLGQDFRIIKDVEVEKGKTTGVNKYFMGNPEMVLGKHSLKGTMRGGGEEYTLLPTEKDLKAAIERGPKALPQNIAGEGTRITEKEALYAERGQKEGVLLEKDGKFYVVEGGRLVEPRLINSKKKLVKAISGKGRERRARMYLRVKEATQKIIDRMQAEDATDAEIAQQGNPLWSGYWSLFNIGVQYFRSI